MNRTLSIVSRETSLPIPRGCTIASVTVSHSSPRLSLLRHADVVVEHTVAGYDEALCVISDSMSLRQGDKRWRGRCG